MTIGVAAIGRLSEDTGGRNYIEHFFGELARQGPQHPFVLFLSKGEETRVKLPQADWLSIVTVPHTSRTPVHKVIGEQLMLPRAIRKSKIDVMYFPGNFAPYVVSVPYVLNIRAVPHYYGSKYGVSLVRRIMRRTLMGPSA